MPDVKICDVTLRDGMQIVNRNGLIPLETRLKLLDALERSRVPYLEVGSFVNPRVIVAMRDSRALLEEVRPVPGQQIAVLVPNLKYYGKLREAPNFDTVALFISASEGYSLANTRMTVDEAATSAAEVAAAARQDGYRLRAYLSCAFRDLSEANQETPVETVRALCEKLVAAGCEDVALSDTDGRATPKDIERVVGALAGSMGLEHVGVHLHDRYGLGITNAYVAWEQGVRIFDSSIGGVGGSRAVQHSVGNIATEELLYMFRGIGVETGIDGDALADAGRIVFDMTQFVGDPMPPSKILADTLVRQRHSLESQT